MQYFSYTYFQKSISGLLILAIFLSQIVVIDPFVKAYDVQKETMSLVVVLAARQLLMDTEALSTSVPEVLTDTEVKKQLKEQGITLQSQNTVAEKILRYVDDIQKQLPQTKVLLVPVDTMDTPEKTWKIQQVLERMYTEGLVEDDKVAKLQGVVMIGDIPLPLVNKEGKSFLSIYPYTDFEDPTYVYSSQSQEFLYRKEVSLSKPEVWHGVIRYPVSWQQYILDDARAQKISNAKNQEEKNTVIDTFKKEYQKLQREELSTYFDRNHAYYTGDESATFSQKAIQMDLFRELGSVTDTSLAGYQEYIENWGNISYLRFTKKWLNQLQEKYYPTTTNLLESAGAVPSDNPALTTQEQSDVFAGVKKIASELDSKKNVTQNLMPDVFTKQPIEKFLQKATDVFSFANNSNEQYFAGTGRWNFFDTMKQGTTIYKIIAAMDDEAISTIRSVNDSLEQALDKALDTVANDPNLMIDMPSGEVGYFGRFFKAIRNERPHPYISVDPATEWSNNYGGAVGKDKISFVKDEINTQETSPTDPTAKKYVAYTGQAFDEVKVHVENIKDEQGKDLSSYKLTGFAGYLLGSVRGGGDGYSGKETVYYNPTARQEMYIEYTNTAQMPNLMEGYNIMWNSLLRRGTDAQSIAAASVSKPHAVLHIVNKPFSAEDCTIFVGGAPESGIFIRGESSVDAPAVEGWNNGAGSGDKDWRKEKINAQVEYEVAGVDVEILKQEENLKKAKEASSASANQTTECPMYPQEIKKEIFSLQAKKLNVEADALEQWTVYYNQVIDPEVFVSQLVDKRTKAVQAKYNAEKEVICDKDPSAIEKAKNDAIAKLTTEATAKKETYRVYMQSPRGDNARFSNFIAYAKSLSQDLSQTIEANKLYNLNPDAYMESSKADKTEQKVRPECEYYEDLFPDGTGEFNGNKTKTGYKAGYLGDCCAVNLELTPTGEAVPADTSAAKTVFTTMVEQARSVNTNILEGITSFLSFGLKDKIGAEAVAFGLKKVIQDQTYQADFSSPDGMRQLVAVYRGLPDYEKRLKAFTKPMHIVVAQGTIKLVKDASYNPSKDSIDPIDKLVATYRSLDKTATPIARYKLLDSIIQIAITQSNFDLNDATKQKHICTPAKALVPIKDLAGGRSVEDPAYVPLTATKVVTREDRKEQVPDSYSILPDTTSYTADGDPSKQKNIVSELFQGTDPVSALVNITKQNNEDRAKIAELFAQYFSKGVRIYFENNPWNSGPSSTDQKMSEVRQQDTIVTGTMNLEASPREMTQTQNRYWKENPAEEAITPETSFKACYMYADYGMPVTEAEKIVRRQVQALRVPGSYGPQEQLAPQLDVSNRTWTYEPPEPGTPVQNFMSTVVQKENKEEALGLDKKEKIVSIIKHKEPTNETIAKQLKTSTSFELPVDSPRYVDMSHYDPIPQWGVIKKPKQGGGFTYTPGIISWKEFYEHIRFPYIDFFSLYGKDMKFSFVIESGNTEVSHVSEQLKSIKNKADVLMKEMSMYLEDYLAHTSLAGEAGNNRNTLKDFRVEYEQALKENPLITDVPAEQKYEALQDKLAFSIYWKHLSLADKYKYVLATYLRSDVSPTQEKNTPLLPNYFSSGKGFEVGNIILASPFTASAPVPFEALDPKNVTKNIQAVVPATPQIATNTNTCKDGATYNPAAVPLLEWPSVIANCWIPSLYPIVQFPQEQKTFQEFAESFLTPVEQATTLAENFVGAVLDSAQQAPTVVQDNLNAFAPVVQEVADLAFNVSDTDGDGLLPMGLPADPNIFSADSKSRVRKMVNGKAVSIYTDAANGLPDVQDYVEQLGIKYQNVDVDDVVMPLQSADILTLTVEARSKDAVPLNGNNFDYIQVVLDEQAQKFIEIPELEKTQRTQQGVVQVHVHPKVSAGVYEGTIKFVLLRQKEAGGAEAFVPMDPSIEKTVSIKATDAHLQLETFLTPSEGTGRTNLQLSSFFTTQEKSFTLSLVAVESSAVTEDKNGGVTLVFQRYNPTKKRWEEERKEEVQLKRGVFLGLQKIFTKAGTYKIRVIPEKSLALPQMEEKITIVEANVQKVALQMQPSVLIEGQQGLLIPKFLDALEEEVVVSQERASLLLGQEFLRHFTVPNAEKIDAVPYNNIYDGASLRTQVVDFLVGSIRQIAVNAQMLPSEVEEKLLVPVTMRLSTLRVAEASIPVYKKGALTIKTTLASGSLKRSVDGDKKISAHITVEDKRGQLVPYTGVVPVYVTDQKMFVSTPKQIQIQDGKGTLELEASGKAGATSVFVRFEDERMVQTQPLDLVFEPGKAQTIAFVLDESAPLQPKTMDKIGTNATRKVVRIEVIDGFGNLIKKSQELTVHINPGNGLLLKGQEKNGNATNEYPSVSEGGKKLYQIPLVEGKAVFIAETTEITGQMHMSVEYKNEENKILSDTTTIVSQFTIDKDFLQFLRPNILYTNLFGGAYGDVTKQDFLAGWWLFSGKGQAVTASTVDPNAPTSSVVVRPNGTIALSESGLLAEGKVLVPLLMPDRPFQIEVREQGTNAPLMRVRYRIEPLATIQEVASLDATEEKPGLYYKRGSSVSVMPTPDKGMDIYEGQEKVLHIDSTLRMTPIGAVPRIDVDTMNSDNLRMTIMSTTGNMLLQLKVILSNTPLYQHTGDEEQDVAFALASKQDQDFRAQAKTGVETISYNSQLQAAALQIEEEGLATTTGKDLYTNRVIMDSAEKQAWKGGIFLLPQKTNSVLSINAGKIIVGGVETILNLQNLSSSIQTYNNAPLVEATVKDQFTIKNGYLEQMVSLDSTQSTQSLALFSQQFIPSIRQGGIFPLEKSMENPGLYVDSTITLPEGYMMSRSDQMVTLKKREALTGGEVEMVRIFADGSYMRNDEQYLVSRVLVSGMIRYEVREKSLDTVLLRAFFLPNMRDLRILPNEAFSSSYAGIYVLPRTTEVRLDTEKKALLKGDSIISSFTEDHFLNVDASKGYTWKLSETQALGTVEPLLLTLEQNSIPIADIRIQHNEKPLQSILGQKENLEAGDVLIDTQLPVEQKNGMVRIFSPDNTLLLAWNEKNFMWEKLPDDRKWKLTLHSQDDKRVIFSLMQDNAQKAKITLFVPVAYMPIKTTMQGAGIMRQQDASMMTWKDAYTFFVENEAVLFSLQDFASVKNVLWKKEKNTEVSLKTNLEQGQLSVDMRMTNKTEPQDTFTWAKLYASYGLPSVELRTTEGEEKIALIDQFGTTPRILKERSMKIVARDMNTVKEFWQQKEENGVAKEEKKVAQMDKWGNVELFDEDYQWNYSMSGDLLISLTKKSSNENFTVARLTLSKGWATRILPFSQGETLVYSKDYQGAYVDILDENYVLNTEELQIQKKDTESSVVHLNQAKFLDATDGYILSPVSSSFNDTTKKQSPALVLKEMSSGKNIAIIHLQLQEKLPSVTVSSVFTDLPEVQRTPALVVQKDGENIEVEEKAGSIYLWKKEGEKKLFLMSMPLSSMLQDGFAMSEQVELTFLRLARDGYEMFLRDKATGDIYAKIVYHTQDTYMREALLASDVRDALKRPGVYVQEMRLPWTFTRNAAGFDGEIRFGFDSIASYLASGAMMPKALLSSMGSDGVLSFMQSTFGTWFYDATGVSYSTQKVSEKSQMETIMASATNNTLVVVDHLMQPPFAQGIQLQKNEQGLLTALTVANEEIARIESTSLPTAKNGYVLREISPVHGARVYQMQNAAGALIGYVGMKLTFPQQKIYVKNIATDVDTENTSTTLENLPLTVRTAATEEKITTALSALGAQGIYVQKMTPSTVYHMSYQPSGDSTGNTYAIALEDTTNTYSTLQPGGSGILANALSDAARSIGWSGNLKNLTLFAAGNSVGKSTLPQMDETLINIGDPVISLQVTKKENTTNTFFTDDVGEFIMEHAGEDIHTLKFYDFDDDGKKDMLYAEASGKIFGIKNMGGNPVTWRYVGEILTVSEGIRKLFIAPLDGDTKEDIMVTTEKAAGTVSSVGDDPVRAVEGSIVSFLQKGGGIFQKGVDALDELGKVEEMSLGDFDGNGTSDIIALTSKNELRTILMGPTLPDGSKPGFKNILLDTLGVDLTTKDMAGSDIFVRYPKTPLFDEAPRAEVENSDIIFVPVQTTQNNAASTVRTDAVEKEGLTALDQALSSVPVDKKELSNQQFAVYVRATSPYITSMEEKKEAFKLEMDKVGLGNPFSFLTQGTLGLNPLSSFAKDMAAAELLSTYRDMTVTKTAKKQEGGKVRKGDTVMYTITLTAGEKDPQPMDLVDRIPDEMTLLPNSVRCEKESATGEVQPLSKDNCILKDSGLGSYPLQFTSLDIGAREKMRITYSAIVATEPVSYTLTLHPYLGAELAQNGIAGVLSAALLGSSTLSRMAVQISSPSFGNEGAVRYTYKYVDPLFEKAFVPTKKTNPLDTNPMLKSVASLVGLSVDEDGALVKKEGVEPGSKETEDHTREISKKMNEQLKTFMSMDKDEDGLIDFWDTQVVPKSKYRSSTQQNSSAASSSEQMVEERLQSESCRSGGCGLFPNNKAFLVPGASELFEGGDVPTFAFPTPSGVVPVWPPDASYFGSKSVSGMRFYFSPTLSGRMAIALCVAPFDFGNADTSMLSGILPIAPNANCFTVILPDFFNLQELCQQIADGVSSMINGALEVASEGSYGAVKSVKKNQEVSAGNRAYHFAFNDPALTDAVKEKLRKAAQSQAGPRRSYNKYNGAFPKIPMDWVTRQVDELRKFLKLPTIYLRLPDPTSITNNLGRLYTEASTTLSQKESKAANTVPQDLEKARVEAKNLEVVFDDSTTLEQLQASIVTARDNKKEALLKECRMAVAQRAQSLTIDSKTTESITDAVLARLQQTPEFIKHLDGIFGAARGEISCGSSYLQDAITESLNDSGYTEFSKYLEQGPGLSDLARQQKDIAGVMDALSKIPLLRFSTKEVVFDLPWIAPADLYAAKSNLEGVLSQSINNFQKFYRDVAPDCFFQKPEDYNTLQEPVWDLQHDETASTSGGQSMSTRIAGEASTSGTMKLKCIAAAKYGAAAWGSIKGFETTIRRIKEYERLQDKLKKYVQWKAYALDSTVGAVVSIIDFFTTYLGKQQRIIYAWKQAMVDIQSAIKTYEIIPQIFTKFQDSCAGCTNERGSARASLLDSLGSIIPDIPVVQAPAWPDIVIDLSDVKAQLRVTLPDIKVRPVPFDIPRLTPLDFPDFNADIDPIEFSAFIETGSSKAFGNLPEVKIPELPAIPELPDLPNFPELTLPKLPDLPPAPVVPQLSQSIIVTLDILDKILQNLCLVKKNVIPIPESQLSSQIESLTRGTALFSIKQNRPSEIAVRSIERIELRLTAKLLGSDGEIIVGYAQKAADYVNTFTEDHIQNFMTNGLAALNKSATQWFTEAAAKRSVTGEKTLLDNLYDGLRAAEKAMNNANTEGQKLEDGLQDCADDLTSCMDKIRQKNTSTVSFSEDGSMADKDLLAQAKEDIARVADALAQEVDAIKTQEAQEVLLMNQLGLLEQTMTDLPTMQGTTFIERIDTQIALLEKEGAHLGKVKEYALDRLYTIRKQAQERTVQPQEYAPVVLTHWNDMKHTLEQEQQKVASSLDKVTYISSASSMEEFRQVLQELSLLSTAQEAPIITASSTLPAEKDTSLLLSSTFANTFSYMPVPFETLLDVEQMTSMKDYTAPVQEHRWTSSVEEPTLIAQNLQQPVTAQSATSASTISQAKGFGQKQEGDTTLMIQPNLQVQQYIPLIAYNAGSMNMEFHTTDLNGDTKDDFVYSMGREIYLKYSVELLEDTMPIKKKAEPFVGIHRVTVRTLESLLPHAPALSTFSIVHQTDKEVTIALSQALMKQSIGTPWMYALRIHRDPTAWMGDAIREEKQDRYVEYYVYASPESSYAVDDANKKALTEKLQLEKNTQSQLLSREDLGTPKDLLYVVPQDKIMRVTLPFQKTGVAYSITAAPYFPETKTYGTFTTARLAHPQRGFDRTPPTLTVVGGDAQNVGYATKITLQAEAQDTSGIKKIYWDTDPVNDTSKDGDTTNDAVVSCTGTCATRVEGQKAISISPEATIGPWTVDDIGTVKKVYVMAEDTLGNVAKKALSFTIADTRVHIDTFDKEKGELTGHVEPPVANAELRLLRMRKEGDIQHIQELPVGIIKTDEKGTFVVRGVYGKNSIGLLGQNKSPLAELDPATGQLTVSAPFENKILDVMISEKERMVATTAMLTLTDVRTEDVTLVDSMVRNKQVLLPNMLLTHIVNTNALRVEKDGTRTMWQVLKDSSWSTLYTLEQNTDLSFSLTYNKVPGVTIGGEIVQKEGSLYALMRMVDGQETIGAMAIPLTESDILVRIK